MCKVRITYFSFTTFGSIRGKTRINLVDTQIDYSSPTRNYQTLKIYKTVWQYCHRFHPKFQPFVEMSAVKHTTKNIPEKIITFFFFQRPLQIKDFHLLVFTFKVRLIKFVVAAVSMPCALRIHLVALLITWFPCNTPQELALIRTSATKSVVTKRLQKIPNFQLAWLLTIPSQNYVISWINSPQNLPFHHRRPPYPSCTRRRDSIPTAPCSIRVDRTRNLQICTVYPRL